MHRNAVSRSLGACAVAVVAVGMVAGPGLDTAPLTARPVVSISALRLQAAVDPLSDPITDPFVAPAAAATAGAVAAVVTEADVVNRIVAVAISAVVAPLWYLSAPVTVPVMGGLAFLSSCIAMNCGLPPDFLANWFQVPFRVASALANLIVPPQAQPASALPAPRAADSGAPAAPAASARAHSLPGNRRADTVPPSAAAVGEPRASAPTALNRVPTGSRASAGTKAAVARDETARASTTSGPRAFRTGANQRRAF